MKKFYIFIPIFLILQYSSILYSQQWSIISYVNTTQLNCVKFINAYTGIACGVGGIWRSTNCGYNWTQVYFGGNYNSLSSIDTIYGCAVGDSGKVLTTFTGGQTWFVGSSGITDNLNSVYLFDNNFGQAVGQNGKILRTVNGGSSWTANINPFSYDLNFVKMYSSSSSSITVGSSFTNREIFEITGNGGSNWYPMWNSVGGYFKSISELPPGTITANFIAVGTSIKKTTSGGNYWVTINNPTNQILNSLIFLDANSGYSCGNAGVIIKTTNSGTNWALITSTTSNNLLCINFINSQIGWAVGQNGIVIGIGTPNEVKKLNENTPIYFNLYQNYPNPFNPSTKIKFQAPLSPSKGGKQVISLKIYDVLGKEVATLFSSPWGRIGGATYEVEWNASNFSSGVYFYKLTARDFSQTRKLIFLK